MQQDVCGVLIKVGSIDWNSDTPPSTDNRPPPGYITLIPISGLSVP